MNNVFTTEAVGPARVRRFRQNRFADAALQTDGVDSGGLTAFDPKGTRGSATIPHLFSCPLSAPCGRSLALLVSPKRTSPEIQPCPKADSTHGRTGSSLILFRGACASIRGKAVRGGFWSYSIRAEGPRRAESGRVAEICRPYTSERNASFDVFALTGGTRLSLVAAQRANHADHSDRRGRTHGPVVG